jgi:hypothetical protein
MSNGNRRRSPAKRRQLTPAATATQQTESVREGIYVAFTSLSVTIVLISHPEVAASEAIFVIAVTALGTVIAALTADLVSHLVVHDRFMDGNGLRHALRSSLGALVTIVPPLLIIGGAMAGLWPVVSSLWACVGVLVTTLITIIALAIRGSAVPWWQRGLFLAVVALLGVAVVCLQVLAHS